MDQTGAAAANQHAVVWSFHLDGQGGAHAAPGHIGAIPEQGLLWIHLNRLAPQTAALLQEDDLPPPVRQALLAPEPRPRAQQLGGGVLLTLRTVNHNPGEAPEDLVAVRLWAEPRRVISVRGRALLAERDMRRILNQHNGPRDAGEVIITFTTNIMHRFDDVIEELHARLDDLDDIIWSGPMGLLRQQITELRREIIALRRYITPDREALAHLIAESIAWLGHEQRWRLRAVVDHTTWLTEELDALRDQAAVLQDALGNRLSMQINRALYVFATLSAVFMPVTFIAGLFGMNVGGIPGTRWPGSFLVISLLLIGVIGLQLWLLRRLRLLFF